VWDIDFMESLKIKDEQNDSECKKCINQDRRISRIRPKKAELGRKRKKRRRL
jgi:hypothetical protein